MDEKQCKICRQVKKVDEFYPDKKIKGGKRNECKSCRKKYNQKHKEARRLNQRKYFYKNRETINIKAKERYWKDIEKTRRVRRLEGQKWRDRNIEKCRRWGREQYQRHRVETLENYKKRLKTDTKYRLKVLVSAGMRRALLINKNGRKWETIVGYTAKDLERHLRKTIPHGYSWDDFLKGNLHIDHKIPIVAFNFSSEKDLDFKRCFSMKNLRLLPAIDNYRKNRKLIEPFQPSLKGI
jgi:hypothetical protein